MNLKKIKFLIIAKDQNINTSISIDSTQIEKVQHYKYLGTIISETVEQLQEVKSRIDIVRNSFLKLKKFLCSRDINLNLRI